MLVLIQVSSTKTRGDGSSHGSQRRQDRRLRRTSARSCSSARRSFFVRLAVASQSEPDGVVRHRRASPGQLTRQSVQRHMRLGLDPRQQPVAVRVELGARHVLAQRRQGKTDPVSRNRRAHFTAEDGATPNRSAATRQLIPPSTAATTRLRRSSEHARTIPTDPLTAICVNDFAILTARETL